MEPKPSKVVVVLSLALLLFGAVNLIRLAATNSPDLHAAPGAGYAVAFVFVIAAIMVVLQTFTKARAMDVLAIVALAAMAVAFAWVGLTGDERYCSASGPPFLPLPTCRVGLAVGAVFLLLMTWVAARGWWRRRKFIRDRTIPPKGSHWPGEGGGSY